MSMVTTPSPSASGEEIDLTDVWQILWREKIVVLALTLLALLIALLAGSSQPKTYVAEATLLPTPRRGEATEVLAAGMAAQLGPVAAVLGGLAPYKSPDLVALLKSRALAEQVATKHAPRTHPVTPGPQLDETAEQISGMISVLPAPDSPALRIRASAQNPELAATLANAYVTELKTTLDRLSRENAAKRRAVIERYLGDSQRQAGATTDADKAVHLLLMQQLEATRLAEIKESDDFLALDAAKIPRKPDEGRSKLFLPLGLFAGLTLGVMGAFVSNGLRGRLPRSA